MRAERQFGHNKNVFSYKKSYLMWMHELKLQSFIGKARQGGYNN